MNYTNDINEKTYYGFALKMDEDDKRHKAWREQRSEFGFDSTELWDLSGRIVDFSLKRLKMAQANENPLAIKTKHYFKGDLEKDREKALKIIDKIVEGFEIYQEDEYIGDKEKTEKVDRAFKLFFKHFHGFWC